MMVFNNCILTGNTFPRRDILLHCDMWMMRLIKSYMRNFELKDGTLPNKCLLHLYMSWEPSAWISRQWILSCLWSLRSQKSIVSSHREPGVDQCVQRGMEMDSYSQEVKLKKGVLGYKLVLNLKKQRVFSLWTFSRLNITNFFPSLY